MRQEDYNALYDLIGELRQEISELDSKIDSNLRKVREAEAHLKAFTDAESDDFRVFSPRRAEATHREEIDRIRNEKASCEKMNEILNGRREVLKERSDKLEEILSRQKSDSISQKKTAREEKNAIIGEMERLINKIEQGSADIERNPIQAKQDFIITAKQLRELADKIDEKAFKNI